MNINSINTLRPENNGEKIAAIGQELVSLYDGQRNDPDLLRKLPKLILGTTENIRLEEEPSLRKKDLPEQNTYLWGLENYVFLQTQHGVPACVFDHHQHALIAWAAAIKHGLAPKQAKLLHVDAHADNFPIYRPFKKGLQEDTNIGDLFEYVITKLNEGNFIAPAVEMDIIGQTVSVEPYNGPESITYDKEIPNFMRIGIDNPIIQRLQQEGPYIFDLDIDYMYPLVREMLIDFKLRQHKESYEGLMMHDMAIIKALAAKASFITVATSPMHTKRMEKEAIKLVKEILM